ncbi:protein kinase domain-containing protein [Candidatus Oscillochloris fontis]|uniref:protein kinase domain-containing protein n=1 Tax=Candidatus Oscillochloris fontis TaxID=2496868 RepID=UPI00101C4012|nr:protein kinase [Candidatus Oscillochloris fontis]
MSLPPGTLVNQRYEIVRQVGQGGMGAVYEARDTRLGHPVALKQTLVTDAQYAHAFEREARLLAFLQHPNLPRVTDHFHDQTGQFLVMSFIPGEDLASLLHQRNGPFPLDMVLGWADHLLDALDYLHTQSPPVLHRDIKPQNLKLNPRGQLILLDFGLAKGALWQTRVTSGGSVMGYTPAYAPMEQIQASGTDERSDLYAAAATLYHLLVGSPPPSALERAAALMKGQPDPLLPVYHHVPGIPVAIGDLLHQAMHPDPDQRPATAATMRSALRQSNPHQPSPTPSGPLNAVGTPTIAAATVQPRLANPPPIPVIATGAPPASPATKPRLPIKLRTKHLRWGLPLIAILIAVITILVLNIPSGELEHTLEGHTRTVESVAFSPDSTLVASAAWNDPIHLWRVSDGELVREFNTGDPGGFNHIAFSSNGQTIAGTSGAYVYLWRVRDGELLYSLHHSYVGFLFITSDLQVKSIAFSPDGELLAVGCNQGIWFWRTSDGSQTTRLANTEEESVSFSSVAFSPDSKLLAGADSNNVIRVWRREDNRQIEALSVHTKSIYRVIFSPDGRLLASASADGTIRIWEVSDPQYLVVSHPLLQTISPNIGPIYDIAFAPDSQTLASVGDDGLVRFWDVRTGDALAQFKGHQSNGASKFTRAVAFASNGRRVASSGSDNTVRLWRYNP